MKTQNRTTSQINDFVAENLKPSDLIILGGRPGSGKTEFACRICETLTLSGKKAVYFSLSEPRELLLKRFKSVREGNDGSLFVDDSAGITVPVMARKIRALGEADCVIIDYLGLISPCRAGLNRSEEVAEIIGGMKAMAAKFNIPVLCLAQLSKDKSGKTVLPESDAVIKGSDKLIII